MGAAGGRSAADVLAGLFRRNDGVLTWESFIAAALYDPDVGYYTRQIADVGALGDFATSATLGTGLGRAIANRVKKGTRSGTPFSAGRPWLVEVGGGNGALMSRVLADLEPFSDIRRRIGLVDISEPLLARQKRRLRGRHVRHAGDLGSLVQSSRADGYLFANELIDAFPPVVLEYSAQEEGWSEVVLRVSDGRVVETVRAAEVRAKRALELTGFLPAVARMRLQRCRVEVPLAFYEWLSGIRELLRNRATWRLLLIDYGGGEEEMLVENGSGTLRAYEGHERFVGSEVMRRFGRRDITFDVNFDDIRRWALGLGFRVLDEGTQADLLASVTKEDLSPADRRLADPGDAGGRFRFLELEIAEG